MKTTTFNLILHTNEEFDALIEIYLPTEDMIYLLKSIYKEWKEIKVEIKELVYDIVRDERHIQLKTNAITFVVQK